jgi:hypothetical protein
VNWEKLMTNKGRHVKLQPDACFLDPGGRQIPYLDDDWLITDATPDRLKITNTRTQHQAVLAKDHVHHFTSDLIRSPDGSDHGFLTLLVQLFIKGNDISIKPCLKPGEAVSPPPVIEIEDKWVDMFYPGAVSLAQKLGVQDHELAWCRDSRVHTLIASGSCEIALERDRAGRLYRLRRKDRPECQTLMKRLRVQT